MGIYRVTINNFKRGFQHKALFALTLTLPILLCIIVGFIDFEKTSIRIGLLGVEKFSEQEKSQVEQILCQSEGVKYASAKEKTLHTDIITGKFHIILDYRESSTIEQPEVISLQKAEKQNIYQSIITKGLKDNELISLKGSKMEGLKTKERMIAVILSLFMIFATILGSSLIQDKQNGTYIRYQYACNKKNGYILGALFYNFIITYFQIIICMSALSIIQKDFKLTALEGVLLPIAITLFTSVFAILICMVCKSEVQANVVSSSLTAILSLLGGTFIAVDAMPGLLKILSLCSPIRWIVELARIL